MKNKISFDVLYFTYYRYDEAGNRIHKTRWEYTGSDPDPVFDLTGDTPPWTLQSDEFYVRDVSGKEIALYSGSSLTQWNIWGLDNVGKINSDTTRNYYLKDHLGSIRLVLNSTNGVVSAQDYDAWGYLLENRTYNSSVMRYDFTGKERDNETSYDYFGARYYDSRIGRWGQVEPLLENFISISPYIYSICNPMNIKDLDGNIVVLSNEEQQIFFEKAKNIIETNEDLNSNVGLLREVSRQSERNLIITNYSGGDFVGVTGQIKYNLTGEYFKTDAIGIGLNPEFFDIENEYLAALVLEHELVHLDFYTREKGFTTGTHVSEWQEKNKLEFYQHELATIHSSLEKLEKLYKNSKITKNEYEEAKKQWTKYEKKTQKRITKYENKQKDNNK